MYQRKEPGVEIKQLQEARCSVKQLKEEYKLPLNNWRREARCKNNKRKRMFVFFLADEDFNSPAGITVQHHVQTKQGSLSDVLN